MKITPTCSVERLLTGNTLLLISQLIVITEGVFHLTLYTEVLLHQPYLNLTSA